MRKLHPGQESTAGNVRLADRKIEVVTSLKGLPHYKEHTGIISISCLYAQELRTALGDSADVPRFEIQIEGSSYRIFIEHDHMIEALASNGADHSLYIGTLPRRARFYAV